MGETQKDNKDNVERKNNDKRVPEKNSQILNVLLTIIVLITVITGAVIYYSLYKYSSNENIIDLNVTNTKKEEEVSTVADILDTALNSNVTNTEQDQTIVSSSATRKYYSNYRRGR